MTINTAENIDQEAVDSDLEDNDSERPTMIPRSRASSTPVDTSDVDATWPEEAPRESFIHQRTVPRDDSGTFRMASALEAGVHRPAADIYEDARALLVLVELPGVTPDTLAIQLSNTAIHVSGSIPEDARRQSPLPAGRYEIVIDVPRGTEGDAIDASLRNGVLRVRVDKSGATTRHVDIAHSP